MLGVERLSVGIRLSLTRFVKRSCVEFGCVGEVRGKSTQLVASGFVDVGGGCESKCGLRAKPKRAEIREPSLAEPH